MSSKQPSTSAKILYRPVGLVSSVIGGLLAGGIFKQVWRRAAPGEKSDPPKPLETEYPYNEIILAAAIQGAISSRWSKPSSTARPRRCLRNGPANGQGADCKRPGSTASMPCTWPSTSSRRGGTGSLIGT